MPRSRASMPSRRHPTPPINLLFQVYHYMIVMGPALAAIGLLGGLWYPLEAAAVRVPVRPVAPGHHRVPGETTITAGWWTAEIGRQPWVVYNVLLTANGVSPVLTALDVVVSLGMFIVLYGLLLVLFLYLLNRKIQEGPEELEDVETCRCREPARYLPRHLQPATPGGRPG